MEGAALLPIALGLLSAITLAMANTLVKAGVDILAGRAVLSSSAALLLLPAAFLVPLPDQGTWIALAWTLPAHWLYQTALVKALHRGDLSLVFPVMRGLAPLLTAIAAFFFLGETLSYSGLAGLALATLAVIAFALPPRGTRMGTHPDGMALFWATLTGIGIALYNVGDANGVRTAPNPFTFIVWLFLLDWIWLTAAVLVFRKGTIVVTIQRQWRTGVAAGALSIVSFGASLLALDLMEAARVSALRETAVVFAALMGWRFLSEGFGLRRTFAAAVLAGSLVLMNLA